MDALPGFRTFINPFFVAETEFLIRNEQYKVWSYNHSLPRIWGVESLYQRHKLWDSAKEERGCCPSTSQLSDLVVAQCLWAAPFIWTLYSRASLGLWGWRKWPLPQGIFPYCFFCLPQVSASDCHSAALRWISLFCCLVQNFLHSVLLGAISHFVFAKWPFLTFSVVLVGWSIQTFLRIPG